MSAGDITIDALRYAEDNSQIASSLIGTAPYQVNLITITNASLSYNAAFNTIVRTSQRLTAAAAFDGYVSYGPGDGYINLPLINTLDANTVLSQQAITDMRWVLGPIVFPYTFGSVSGGIDSNIFYPASSGNVEIFIQLIGPGLNPNTGNYFKAVKTKFENGNNIYYFIEMQNAGVVVA